jgi:hypothetical protein
MRIENDDRHLIGSEQMAFKKGISGNPGGAPKEKAFAEAVRLVSKRVDGQDKKTNLMKLADQLFKHALKDGEGWAFSMIADRLDGKPVQQTDVNVRDMRDRIEQFSDDELTVLMRGRMAEEAKKPPPPPRQVNEDGNVLN